MLTLSEPRHTELGTPFHCCPVDLLHKPKSIHIVLFVLQHVVLLDYNGVSDQDSDINLFCSYNYFKCPLKVITFNLPALLNILFFVITA